MEKSNYSFLTVGDRIFCNSWKDLLQTSFRLSSEGYGVSVIGFADMSDNVLTITADKSITPITEADISNEEIWFRKMGGESE